uniref:Uncharacterized protein n=1 Tax=viral metagenome TaxID=1070528 RepID=A0A6C0AXX4_9ZZZZ|tara:strand:+ start:78 stop:608 length:531 start_codon:yes stop_codon:yes gene_type:complete
MNINFEKRKWEMQLERRFIDIFEWEKYLETVYPDWWNSLYNSMWPVRIIYYNYDNSLTEFYFHINRYSSMDYIMNKVYLLLKQQFAAVSSCFGHDIAFIIYNYMSDLFDPNNNYLYYHSRPLDIDYPNSNKINRVLLNPTTTLNELSCALRNDPVISRFTNIRLRAKPYKKPFRVL